MNHMSKILSNVDLGCAVSDIGTVIDMHFYELTPDEQSKQLKRIINIVKAQADKLEVLLKDLNETSTKQLKLFE